MAAAIAACGCAPAAADEVERAAQRGATSPSADLVIDGGKVLV
jgi:hypothetical protein